MVLRPRQDGHGSTLDSLDEWDWLEVGGTRRRSSYLLNCGVHSTGTYFYFLVSFYFSLLWLWKKGGYLVEVSRASAKRLALSVVCRPQNLIQA